MHWRLRGRRVWIVRTTAVVAGMLVSLGLLATMRPSPTSAVRSLRRVRVFGTTLWVPPTWRKRMSANATLQSRTVTFSSRLGQLTLTRYRFMGFLPLVGNVPSGPFLRNTNSPYVISWHQTIGEQPTYVAESTLASGAGLALQLTWRHPARETTSLSQRMLTRVRFPAPITVTQAVEALRRSPLNQAPGNSAILTQRILERMGQKQAWLFVSGEPLTDMTAWTPSYLFQTLNGGRTWHLIHYACSGESDEVCAIPGSRHFLGQATPAAMRFVSPVVGIIVQSNQIAPFLDVDRTTDGGFQWAAQHYPLPNLSTAVAPTITETRTGLLTVTVAIQGHSAPVTYGSSNQGRTWYLLPRGRSRSA